MLLRTTTLALALAFGGAAAGRAQDLDRQADAAAIRAHIESIFQGFVDGSRERLAETHAENWRGFLDGSRRVIRGRDGYLRAVEGALRRSPGQGLVGYRITDFDVVFHGPTVAVASFVAEVDSRRGTTVETGKLNIVDVYSRESGRWTQVASGTSHNPESIEKLMAENGALPDPVRADLLAAREAVWRAWFGGDLAALGALLPAELVTLEPGRGGWGTRDSIIRAARQFAESGGTLTKLEFPRTELQVYGRTAIIYTTYLLETARAGASERQAGKAVEIFVWRDGKWLNSGWQLAPDPSVP